MRRSAQRSEAKAPGPFLTLVFYSYQSYLNWMLREGNGLFVARSYASNTLAWYVGWALVGLHSIVKSLCVSIGVGVPFEFGASSYIALAVLCMIFSQIYLVKTEKYSSAVFLQYKEISYLKDFFYSFILLVPMPLMLVIGRDDALLGLAMLGLHWLYLVVVGNFLLHKIRKPPDAPSASAM